MSKITLMTLLLGVFVLYLLRWPVPVEPVSWQAPAHPGYSGQFAPNQRLQGLQTLNIGEHNGPEDVALDSQGRIYLSSHNGDIVRLQADGSQPEIWASTGGRPLGIDFADNGELVVADAYLGLLAISPQGKVTVLVDQLDGRPLLYVDDVAVAADGKVYFSDASSKFSAKKWGTYSASELDIVEHAGYGRLLVYDPQTRRTHILLDGLNFANGVALSHQQDFVLVSETGSYRVMRYWLRGDKQGQSDVFIDQLPGFPDNISQGLDGRFWLALISPRSALLDRLSRYPLLRKMTLRLPGWLRPAATHYGHIVALDVNGQVLDNLQDPEGSYPKITSVTETRDYLYLGSLTAPVLGRLVKGQ